MFLQKLKKAYIRYMLRDYVKYARLLGVKVGENCKFMDNPCWGSEPFLISIGNHCLISSNVSFINHDGATWVFREKDCEFNNLYKFGRIEIKDNCFIGMRSIILPGVVINSDSIIAAGSVVTKNVPSGEVWGGVPAKLICTTEQFAKKCLKNKLPYDDVLINTDKKSEMMRVLDWRK